MIAAQETQKQWLVELPKSRRVDQRPDLPHRVIRSHKLLQIDVMNIDGCGSAVAIIGVLLLMDHLSLTLLLQTPP